MTDLEQILELWKALRTSGAEYVLATVVKVEGSGYRKPGARMLIAADGRRAGTISGGCLEGEVVRKAFWRTENGPVVQRYSTNPEDGEVPYGMGCGGVIHLLLERSKTAHAMLEQLSASFANRLPLTITTILDGEWIGLRGFWPADTHGDASTPIAKTLSDLARTAFSEEPSFVGNTHLRSEEGLAVCVERIATRPGLFVFGAGDDAVPLVRLARQLGWYVVVADGRSHLATRTRFPEAHEVHVLTAGQYLSLRPLPTDVAAVMTHSIEQDTRILRELLSYNLAYIGVLGPLHRTYDMLHSLARDAQLPRSRVSSQVEQWMETLHAPMGLDLGGSNPVDIAFSVIAEIRQTIYQTSGLPLRELRARTREIQKITA